MKLCNEVEAVLIALSRDTNAIMGRMFVTNWEKAFRAAMLIDGMHNSCPELKPYLYLFYTFRGNQPQQCKAKMLLAYGHFFYALWVQAHLAPKPPADMHWLRETADAFYNATNLGDYRCIMTPRSYIGRGQFLTKAQELKNVKA